MAAPLAGGTNGPAASYDRTRTSPRAVVCRHAGACMTAAAEQGVYRIAVRAGNALTGACAYLYGPGENVGGRKRRSLK